MNSHSGFYGFGKVPDVSGCFEAQVTENLIPTRLNQDICCIIVAESPERTWRLRHARIRSSILFLYHSPRVTHLVLVGCLGSQGGCEKQEEHMFSLFVSRESLSDDKVIPGC